MEETGFIPMNEIKEIVVNILESYQKFWREEGVANYGYILRSNDDMKIVKGNYVIEIWCGTDQKVCVIRDSVYITNDDFATIQYAKLNLWKKVLNSIGVMGIFKGYQDTIQLHRDKKIFTNGVDYSKNPLIPSECFKK